MSYRYEGADGAPALTLNRSRQAGMQIGGNSATEAARHVQLEGNDRAARIDYGRREADRDNASRLRVLRQQRLRRAGK